MLDLGLPLCVYIYNEYSKFCMFFSHNKIYFIVVVHVKSYKHNKANMKNLIFFLNWLKYSVMQLVELQLRVCGRQPEQQVH